MARGVLAAGAATVSVLAVGPGSATGASVAPPPSVTFPTTSPPTNTPPTAAAGGLTSYTVTFNVSATGALSAANDGAITVNVPDGAGITDYLGGTVRDNTTGQNVGACPSISTSTGATCPISAGELVNDDDSVTVTLNGINNGTTVTNKYFMRVATTSDSTAVDSPLIDVVAARAPSDVTASNATPSDAAGALTTYAITFDTSSSPTGGLTNAAGSKIDVTLPNGTSDPGFQGAIVRDLSTGANVGTCPTPATPPGAVGLATACTLNSGATIAAGDEVGVTLNGITNPTSPSNTLEVGVSTTSDTVDAASAPFSVVAAGSVSHVTATNATPSDAAGARTSYVASFTLSSTGGLSNAAGSKIEVTVPPGVNAASFTNGALHDVSTGANVGTCTAPTSPPQLLTLTSTCTLNAGATVSGGDELSVTLNGLINPATVSTNGLTMDVTTTSDPSPVASGGFSTVAAAAVSTPAVTLASSAIGTPTTYTVTFNLSASGGLSNAVGSDIAITFPSGTGAGSSVSGTVTNMTTDTIVGDCAAPTGSALVCLLSSGASIPSGDAVQVALDGITNPPTPNADYTLSVSTTSDTRAATSAPYDVGVVIAPANTSRPSISGTAAVGDQLTCSQGAWSGSTPQTYAYQWLRNGTAIAGATSPTYTVAATDASQSLSCTVTAMNAAGGTPATSAAVVVGASSGSGAGGSGSGSGGSGGSGSGSSGGSGSGGSGGVAASGPPSATTTAPSGVGPATATLTGTVDPEGVATTASFEYGLDPSLTEAGGGPVVYDQTTATQSVGSDDAAHTVTAVITGLVPNALYHVRVVAVNADGRVVGEDETFKTTLAAAPPPPVLGHAENVSPVSGHVFIKLPPGASLARADGDAAATVTKGNGFIPLTQARQIPVGSILDTTRGTASVIAASPKKTVLYTADFTGGIFTLLQTRAQQGLTQLDIMDTVSRKTACVSRGKGNGKKASIASARNVSNKVLGLLKSTDHGRFSTRGHYSAATVRGTRYTVEDTCAGTLTTVTRGLVAVNYFHRHRSFLVRAGHAFLALASGGPSRVTTIGK